MRYFAAAVVGFALAQVPVFPPESGRYMVYINRVIDGDTVDFYWLVEAHGRLDGINAPEIHGETKVAGLASKAKLEELAPKGFYTVEVKGKEKYGRTLLWIYKDGKLGTVNKALIDGGFAKPYLTKEPLP